MKPVVVLGFGAAAANAIMALRDAGYERPLVVVTDGGAEPYSPVLTSYYAGGRITRDRCFVWADRGLSGMIDDLRSHAWVEALDAVAHEIVLADGERIGYSKLLIATGAHPVALGFPDAGSYQPLVLRTLEDADRLGRALAAESCRSVLVSGTSMVGLKVLEACLDRGVRVTLLGRSAHILRSSAHPTVAARFEQLLADRGVRLRLGCEVEAAECVKGGCRVRFDDGETERFDEVVLAQGVKPNIGFIGSDILVEQGILVDDFMHASAPDVFAAGDVAQALDVTIGKKSVIGLWQNAVQQGRCAGRAMADELAGRTPSRPFPGSLPYNIIHVRDILFASVGTVAPREGRRFEMSDDDCGMRVLAYDDVEGETRLVGFNALELVSAEGDTDELDCEVGRRRREILNAHL